MFGCKISGPETQKVSPFVDSVLLPPIVGIEMVDSYKTLNLPQFDLDWEFVYGYVGVKVKDMILEVSSQSASLTQTVINFLL